MELKQIKKLVQSKKFGRIKDSATAIKELYNYHYAESPIEKYFLYNAFILFSLYDPFLICFPDHQQLIPILEKRKKTINQIRQTKIYKQFSRDEFFTLLLTELLIDCLDGTKTLLFIPQFKLDDNISRRFDLGITLLSQKEEKIIIVECDGWEYHKSKDSFTRDRQIDRQLLARGIHIQRFSGKEIYEDPTSCALELLILAFEMFKIEESYNYWLQRTERTQKEIT